MADFNFDMGDIDVPDAPDLTPPDPGMNDAALPNTSWTTANDNQGTPDPAVTLLPATAPNPYAQDPSQWDQDTRAAAGLGDMYSKVDQHIQDTNAPPDADTVNKFADQTLNVWGAPVGSAAQDTDAAQMPAPAADISSQGEDAYDYDPHPQLATPSPNDQTSTQTPQNRPILAADSGSMSDAANDIRSPTVQNNAAQQTGTSAAPSCYKPITPEEQQMAKAGDAEGFWKSRQQNGDPIAGRVRFFGEWA